MTWIVLLLIAAFSILHRHEGSAVSPSTDNDRQVPRTGLREGSRRRQPAEVGCDAECSDSRLKSHVIAGYCEDSQRRSWTYRAQDTSSRLDQRLLDSESTVMGQDQSPAAPFLTVTICAAIATAISAGVWLPMANPAGPCNLATCVLSRSNSSKRSRRRSLFNREPSAAT